jgi:CcmD family protein
VNNLEYLFAAYTVVWLGIALYVRRLMTRLRELDEEIADLHRRVGGSR